MARNGRQYLKAVKWIAYNDDTAELDLDVIAHSVSAALVGDLFGVHECDVAQDVLKYRNAERLADKLRKHPKILMVYRDQDGWWLETKAGWAFDPAEPPYGGCHTISEDTLTELKRHLDEIQPCNCASCQGEKQ